MDSENDLLLDGDEVTRGLNPMFWDTDGDGMSDRFEVQYNLQPQNAGDWNGDPDLDFFDRGNDGSIERPWGNLDEYRFGRPTGYNEATQGPWLLGTYPIDVDTDDDGGSDGYEVYYQSNPVMPADADTDKDGDGLNFTMEVRLQTDPNHPDTDFDGICDGGHGPACRLPGLATSGAYQPGEHDYGTIPWMTDSDLDGLPDARELELWDPSGQGTAQDADADGQNGLVDADSDDDGWTDYTEVIVTLTNPALTDTDADGIPDGRESPSCFVYCIYRHYRNPHKADTDNDGLLDGAEVKAGTYTNGRDSDDDGLLDGEEVGVYGTDPRRRDTDVDGAGDRLEVVAGTNPLVDDMRVDADQDGLTNWEELVKVEKTIGRTTSPLLFDTDGDGAWDGWEFHIYQSAYPIVRADFDPTVTTGTRDTDQDGLTNAQEYARGTDPLMRSTDGPWDDLGDNAELTTYKTDPLKWDSDGDWLSDSYAGTTMFGALPGELQFWNSRLGNNAVWVDYDQDQSINNLLDSDSDNDKLDDGYEFTRNLNPSTPDTDGDTLSDWDEIFTYRGRYNPRLHDTDRDGIPDNQELVLDDPAADPDHDDLINADEDLYGTSREKADTDCDGVRDGAELNYWGTSWNTGGNRLLTRDVDGDGLEDGLEIGPGASRPVLYQTDPANVDTDGDTLWDSNEDRNSFVTACPGQQSTEASPLLPLPTQPDPLPGPGGLLYGADSVGTYVLGAFGVKLYLKQPTLDNETDLDFLHEAPKASSTSQNTYKTDPTKWDTDGDGISDAQEVDGNPPGAQQRSNPTACDSDGDGLGDMLENGVFGVTAKIQDPSTHRDGDASNPATDPMKADTDNDGLLDGAEDANRNGVVNIGESNPADGDTDDDGILDPNEAARRLLPDVPDTDGDGLSDGLEVGLKNPENDLLGFTWTTAGLPLERCYTERNSWQAYQGTALSLLTAADDADSDNDGILDGLEDLNHNGVYGDAGELSPRNSDSDSDGLPDGLELLVWGQSNADGTHGKLTYDFCDIVAEWGSSEGGWSQKLGFTGADPFQTNPRSGNTDTDGAPDGADLNPRANAAFGVEFGQFFMTEAFDWCDEGTLELYVSSLTVDLPFNLGSYAIHLNPDQYTNIPDARNARLFSDEVLGKLRDPSALDAKPPSLTTLSWAVERVTSRPVLQFDIRTMWATPAALTCRTRT